MVKAEKGSLKDIGKQIKAKGLQKLKFYCQMCEKQCRDANGFKCHLTSDTHLRQMKLFSEHAGSMMDSYSSDFRNMYLETLRMRHGSQGINANTIYQEVIADKQHVHMNSTVWASLSDFVQYLGKMGYCTVEQNERGWYVTYIERDASKLERVQALERRQRGELAAEQAVSVRMREQRVQAAIALDKVGGVIHTQATALERNNGDGGGDDATLNIRLQLAIKPTTKKTTTTGAGDKVKQKSVSVSVSVFGHDEDDDDDDGEAPQGPPIATFAPVVPSRPDANNKPTSTLSSSSLSSVPVLKKRPRPVNADVDTHNSSNHKSQRLESDEHQQQESEPWLCRDILVRIVHKTLGDGIYFKRKAAVDELVNQSGTTARVTVLDSSPNQRDGGGGGGGGDVLELDQDDLETVVPKQTGKRVRILRGQYRGKRATVVELDKRKYRAVLELSDGTILDRFDYDDFSKLAF
jgi:DNA/RNA-binding protein KIN17